MAKPTLQHVQIPSRGQRTTFTGRAVFDGASCQYADVVKPGDMIAANFDAKHVHTGGGLYLLEEREDGVVTWRGCRRMMRVPTGIAVDQDGQGDWKTLSSLETYRWHVVGTIETVYKPIRYQQQTRIF